jgi:hypothetical protein
MTAGWSSGLRFRLRNQRPEREFDGFYHLWQKIFRECLTKTTRSKLDYIDIQLKFVFSYQRKRRSVCTIFELNFSS